MRILLSEKLKDRLMRVVIRVGGIFVILVVVGIVVNISLQALPLFRGASAGPPEQIDSAGEALALGSDPRGEVVWSLGRDGRASFSGVTTFDPIPIFDGPVVVAAAEVEIHNLLSAVTDTGRLVVGELRFRDRWHEGQRQLTVRWRTAGAEIQLDSGSSWAGVTANRDEDGNVLAAAWSGDGRAVMSRWDADDERWTTEPLPSMAGVYRIAVAEDLATVAIVDRDGGLHVLAGPSFEPLEVSGLSHEIGAVRFLIGSGSLIAADVDGTVHVLLSVRHVRVLNNTPAPLRFDGHVLDPGKSVVLPDDDIGTRVASRPGIVVTAAPPVSRVVRTIDGVGGRPTHIAPSHRRRGFLIGSDTGVVGLFHATSGRRLLMGRWLEEPVRALAMAPKADAALVAGGTEVIRRSLANPHPEVSFRTLALPVWYEGYAAPRWVWQSTGGSDGFEPKLSLWPLLFGTLKATLYAMLISVPLALMAAVYVSQLAPTWLQSAVKPTVELMAAVPSVVVGFMAALWLAPRLEAALLPTLLAIAALPLAVVLSLFVWRAVPITVRRRLPSGSEVLLVLIATCGVLVAVAGISGGVERWLFDGDFLRWLYTDLGIRYDQRNSLVVGLALGFAVVPVIFTIAEDACSAVPSSLVNAARALGATPWQTAVKLVVPAASPGLFAAVMLGFGRAVGETMIVLMATGNTPLLDISPFNGMRTMSAAIAVEIPEAPVGGTLFRVLFLTGTLLFVFTLVLTTAADVVGRYLRQRYGRF